MEHERKAVVIRANERKDKIIPGNPVSYQELSPEGVKSVAMFRARTAPGQNTGAKLLAHGGDEILLLLAGTCELEVEGRKHTLKPGDTAFIPHGQRHRLANVGADPSEAVFVLSPPEY